MSASARPPWPIFAPGSPQLHAGAAHRTLRHGRSGQARSRRRVPEEERHAPAHRLATVSLLEDGLVAGAAQGFRPDAQSQLRDDVHLLGWAGAPFDAIISQAEDIEEMTRGDRDTMLFFEPETAGASGGTSYAESKAAAQAKKEPTFRFGERSFSCSYKQMVGASHVPVVAKQRAPSRESCRRPTPNCSWPSATPAWSPPDLQGQHASPGRNRAHAHLPGGPPRAFPGRQAVPARRAVVLADAGVRPAAPMPTPRPSHAS